MFGAWGVCCVLRCCLRVAMTKHEYKQKMDKTNFMYSALTLLTQAYNALTPDMTLSDRTY
jgi:hypothetical protein